MIGYSEEKYDVTKHLTTIHNGIKQITEIRVPKPAIFDPIMQKNIHLMEKKYNYITCDENTLPYISISLINNENVEILDILLIYHCSDKNNKWNKKNDLEKKELMMEDWNNINHLKSDFILKNANAYERIEFHTTGFTKDGFTTMY